MNDPFDFELEDPLLSSPPANKKRKKLIGLDDLLTDYYKQKSKLVEKESKRAKAPKNYHSDEEEDTKEASLSRLMTKIGGDEDISLWGIQVFGNQKSPPPLIFPELKSCKLLQSFMSDKLNSLVELSTENGNSFLEGLLVHGWLLKLILTRGHVEESILIWTFNLMLYSSKEELRTSACDFWCAILSSKQKDGLQPVKITWIPSYCELRKALEVYGYLNNFASNTEAVHADSGFGGPAQNIRAWLKFVTVFCQLRSKWCMLSTSEVAELLEVIICMFLDRKLQGLMVLLYDSMQSVINYFTDKEWRVFCEKIAKSLASRVPKDLNCLRIVECISGVNTRSKHLRSSVAYQILLSCFDYKAASEEILRLLIQINVKDKSCDLFKMYIYMVLAENWLISNKLIENKPVLNEMWNLYLRNCSCQIASTDLRSFASRESFDGLRLLILIAVVPFALPGTAGCKGLFPSFLPLQSHSYSLERCQIDNMKGERMAKRASFGSIMRKKLSDITNLQTTKTTSQDEKLPEVCQCDKSYVDQLFKERITLMEAIAERNKIIELSGEELQKLRVSLQKLQLQNWNLAHSNSQMLTELHLGREKVKALQHELLCRDALLKARNLERQAKAEVNFQKVGSQAGEQAASNVAGTEDKPCNQDRRRATRSRSTGSSSTCQKVEDKDRVGNKRRCLRRQSARFKSHERELEPTENWFEIEDVKISLTESFGNSICNNDDSTPLHFPTVKEEKEEASCASRSEAGEPRRSSIGRPLRKVKQKVQSYKEVPIKVKMRRTDWA
ncbi:hypothetical protein FNV43_RR05363 [Rhamnella rubrinervis]|uniref:Shugoshin C-terminal domain-containing protein n=1 Tax=Rhamnella rubrinervis TaxID=2594499 RepID=A0A8K0HM10_9ROSA|nr:hypothetical protein FNV43_RR05363 [Rhamnella rubrinervis]